MFGGSENLKGRYIDAMERVGATDLNGTTNSDRTNYFENVPTSALDYALFLESDRMGHFYNTLTRRRSTCSAAWCRTKSARAITSPIPSRGI